MRRKNRKFKIAVTLAAMMMFFVSSMNVFALENIDKSILQATKLESSDQVNELAVLPLLVFDEESSLITYFHSFYVRDVYKKSNSYFISSLMAASADSSGYTIYTIVDGEVCKVYVNGNDEYFTYMSCDGIEEMEPIDLGEAFVNDDLYAVAAIIGEDNQVVREAVEIEVGSWENCDGYLNSGEELEGENLMLLGVPAFDQETGELTGMLDADFETSEMICRDVTAIEFTEAYAVTVSAGEEQSTASEQPAQEPVQGAQNAFSSIPSWVYAAAVIVVVGAFYMAKKQKPKKERQESPVAENNDASEGTIALDTGSTKMENRIGTEYTMPAKWQIRGMSGVFTGVTFVLENVLRFGRNASLQVVFPEHTKGVSGNHCELALENGRIILRDLGSTYGTFLKSGEKLNDRVSYELKEGDIFYLADAAQSFRVEKVGESRQEFTPVVKAIVNPMAGELYHADANGEIRFGRSVQNQVSFSENDTKISTNHCVLYRENDVLYLMDLGSTNGTFFAENKRLQPNVAYRVEKGTSFYLTSKNYTFVIVEV